MFTRLGIAHVALPIILTVATVAPATSADRELITNGGFEQEGVGWTEFWSRDGDGQATFGTDNTHGGEGSVFISHDGEQDWSFSQQETHEVKAGEIYELTGWVRIQQRGHVTLGVILRDADDHPLCWDFGGRSAHRPGQWIRLKSHFVIPPEAALIHPRFIGSGPITAWMDDVSLKRVGTLQELKQRSLPESLTIENEFLSLTFDPGRATMLVVDRRTGADYRQHQGSPYPVLDAARDGDRITFRLLKPDDMLLIDGTIQLDPRAAEFVVELHAEGTVSEPITFPAPFVTRPGEFLIMPVNEGISYPVDDPALSPMEYHLWGGHGLCMDFWGTTDTRAGLMAIVETPDDARVAVSRIEERLCLVPKWAAQKQSFGPSRRIRYVLFTDGGYVAMCKRYRRYAQRIERFQTLQRKRQANPHVDRLVGAVNVWCWDRPAVEMCRELQELGIERILWSRRAAASEITQLNEMGVLSSRYDIYQDAMNPENFPHLRWIHPDWTSDAWPDDLLIRQDGQWQRGWRVKGKDGQWYPCGVLCDRRAVEYARRRITQELKTHPYACRFLDTTTASPWRECYHPDHPMTRTESREAKMELLQLVSQSCGLVTGSETGHDAAVPYVHYFEGMLSLGPYRIPDAGRNMLEPVTDVPERVATFQTGHYYRLPLWELVYHDCVIAQWYWGDYNNKLPALWDRRDLFNVLYGTPPMFLFDKSIWNTHRERFVKSYQTAAPVARSTGYSEMLTHQWLTKDHSVQQSKFANGVTVTVNFGQQTFAMEDEFELRPMTHRVQGMASLPH